MMKIAKEIVKELETAGCMMTFTAGPIVAAKLEPVRDLIVEAEALRNLGKTREADLKIETVLYLLDEAE